MIARTADAEHVNRIINDPSVRPWVCGAIEGDLDIAPVLADSRNVALFGEHGGVIFSYLQPALYEAHTQVLPAGRGAWTLQMVNAALAWLFAGTDAVEVLTRVPHGNEPARALAQAVRGIKEFTNPRGWYFKGEVVPADIYALTVQTWMRTAPGLVERGQWFHERLEAEYIRLGHHAPLHDDDAVHDRYVGAALEMALAGQPLKGMCLYNRWAVMAGYHPVAALSLDPVVFDIGEAVISLENASIKVLECR